MSEARGKTSRPWNPEHYRPAAHRPEAKLPQADLGFFLRDTVPHLDWRRFYAPYEDAIRGAPPFAPQRRVCLLLDAYCVGVLSSRTIAQACERTLAFLAIVGEDRPDCRPSSDFRRLPLAAFCDVFVAGRRIAGESGLVTRGTVATDGTKLQGNASRHNAMSYGYMQKEVERWRAEIEALVTQADQQDAEDDAALGSRRGDALPAELARREDRLATREAARQRLEARAQADAEAARQRRAAAEAERQRTGPTRRGRAPKAVDETPEDKAPMRFTAPELQSRQTNNTGWAYCGHAPASVEEAYQIIVACDGTVEPNDTQQAAPLTQWTVAPLEQAGSEMPKDPAGVVQKMPGTSDSGDDREAAAKAVEQRGFAPSMAPGRQRHHVWETEEAEAPTTATARMAANVRTPAGRALYARRKVSVEPVFGQSKEARGCRRFLLRGLDKIRGEWCLVCLTHNLLQIWRYTCAPITV
jgi:Transposase DDE domain